MGMQRGGYIGTQVPVAEHYAFGVTGGSGCVDDGCKVVGKRLGDFSVACESLVISLDGFKSFYVYHQHHPVPAFLADLVQQPFGNEDGLASGMRENIRHLVFGRIRENRD